MSNKIINKTLKLDGMTCIACETKIDKKLRQIEGVIDLKVSYVTSILTISYDQEKTNLKEITGVIQKLGYDIAKEQKVENQKEKNSEKNFWIITGIIGLGVFLIVKHTIGFNFIPEVNQNMGYGILFVIGILTSLHCVAMCGGINLSVCMSYRSNQNSDSKYSKLIPSLMYNAGRVVAYTIIGGIFGAFGSVISITNGGKALVSIGAGVFMVIMGINMLNIFPWLRKLNPHMPKIFAKQIHSQKKNKGPFIVGLLNGLMPCGPLQAMQIYALGTGSFIAGAISMFLFSLGTVPLMFAFGALGSLLSSKFTKNMVKASAVLVVVLGVVMLNRGLAFTGFTVNSLMPRAIVEATNNTDNTKTEDKNAATVDAESGVQKITTTLQPGSYTPITVEAGTPVEWTIVAEAGSLNGCNYAIIIPEYGIEQELQEGETVIKFTPSDAGTFGYSCWMGMIRSSITVVEAAGAQAGEAQDQASSLESPDTTVPTEEESSNPVDNTGLPAGCCGY